MKKIIIAFSALLMFSFISFPVNATSTDRPTTITTSNHFKDSIAANNLLFRLQEIKAMDKSKLSSVEKKELRKETRGLKKQLRQISGGVYLSGGALILIVLLLILLL